MKRRRSLSGEHAGSAAESNATNGLNDSIAKNDSQRHEKLPTLVGALQVLAFLSIFCGAFTYVGHQAMFMKFIVPLSGDAPLDKFSEGRAMQHVWAFAGENVTGRQEGSPGLMLATKYIKDELLALKARASPKISFEIDESYVNGSMNMDILEHSLSFKYRNHPNVAARISARGASEDAAAVLLNAHFDAPLGSPGASDCASCAASLLETARQIVDSGWVPPAPVIFLFNGAEELFLLIDFVNIRHNGCKGLPIPIRLLTLQATHGFVTQHKWSPWLGAIINVESSGACGPDLVVQSGPGSWPSRVYYESAVHPMANSVAQNIFPLIPGDTDYRVFAQDFSNIPGLDLVLLLKGAVYHTPYDKPELIVPGSLQGRGENLISLIKGFTAAPELKGFSQRAAEAAASSGQATERRPVFFDIWGKWMVFYSHKAASALHLLPLAVVFLAPGLASPATSGVETVQARFQILFQGLAVQIVAALFGVLFPVTLAIMRLSASSTAMTWFSRPWIAVMVYTPCSLAGVLIPRVVWLRKNLEGGTKQEALDWAGHWGSALLYAIATATLTLLGGSGYLEFVWALFLIPAFSVFQFLQHTYGRNSLLAMTGYVAILSLPVAYSLYFGEMLLHFLGDKSGMIGSIPLPYGFFVSDVIMAAIVGSSVAYSVGPVIPVLARWMGSPRLIRLLLYTSIGAAALSSRAFPYSYTYPKRLILQHSIQTEGSSKVTGATFDFAAIDPNPVTFIWKNVPDVAQSLQLSKSQLEEEIVFDASTFMALYPITRMIDRGTSVPVKLETSAERQFPLLVVTREEKFAVSEPVSRRVHIELELGDLRAIWGAVINVTGPLVKWSFAEEKLPTPEVRPGGPQSFICRMSGHSVDSEQEKWLFWLEASSEERLRIELSVIDQKISDEIDLLVASFPAWVATVSGTSYLSTYFV